MKLYLIGGLGADKRVFKHLKLNCESQSIEWLDPKSNENLQSYSTRLLSQVNQNEKYGILGVSFGGIVALELAKLCNPEIVILISSVENRWQLPRTYLAFGKAGILKLIPNALIRPPKSLLGFLFGTRNTELLREIIEDTKPDFIRWALNEIINWPGISNPIKPIRIHGTRDRLIPLKGEGIKVEFGGHFMIVDRADEISQLVNEQIKHLG